MSSPDSPTSPSFPVLPTTACIAASAMALCLGMQCTHLSGVPHHELECVHVRIYCNYAPEVILELMILATARRLTAQQIG